MLPHSFAARRRDGCLSSSIAILLILPFHNQCTAVLTDHKSVGGSQDFCHVSDAPDTRSTLCNSFIQVGKKQVQVPSFANVVGSEGGHSDNKTSSEKPGAKDGTESGGKAKNDGNISAQAGKAKNDGTESGAPNNISEVAAQLVVALLLAGIVIAAIVLAMTHSTDSHLSSLSIFALEATLSFFVGVMWFQALDSLIESLTKTDTQVAVSIANAIFWVLVLLALAWIFRKKSVIFALITGCCTYIAAFFVTHAAYLSQRMYYSNHWMDCLHGLCVLLVIMGMVFSLCYLLKMLLFGGVHDEWRDQDANEYHWHDTMGSMESLFFGMAAAFAFTEFIRFLIAGKFPQPKGINHNHTNIEKHMLLGWVVAISAIGGGIVWHLAAYQEVKKLSFLPHLFLGFACSFFSMCIAWAVLDWGQWYMYEWVHLGPIFSRVVFALICTGVWIAGVCVLASFRKVNPRFSYYFVLALALLSAWSWGQVLNYAFDRVWDGWWAKAFVACAITALVVPITAFLLKPVTRHSHHSHPTSEHYDNKHVQHAQHVQHTQQHEHPRHIAAQPITHGSGWTLPRSEKRVDSSHLLDTRARLPSSHSPLETSPLVPDVRAHQGLSPIRSDIAPLRTNQSPAAEVRIHRAESPRNVISALRTNPTLPAALPIGPQIEIHRAGSPFRDGSSAIRSNPAQLRTLPASRVVQNAPFPPNNTF